MFAYGKFSIGICGAADLAVANDRGAFVINASHAAAFMSHRRGCCDVMTSSDACADDHSWQSDRVFSGVVALVIRLGCKC
jgi:hypothetical protein